MLISQLNSIHLATETATAREEDVNGETMVVGEVMVIRAGVAGTMHRIEKVTTIRDGEMTRIQVGLDSEMEEDGEEIMIGTMQTRGWWTWPSTAPLDIS